MYLKKLQMVHFRKFDEQSNTVEFVAPEQAIVPSGEKDSVKDEAQIASATTLIIGKNNVGKTTIIQALRRLAGLDSGVVPQDFCYSYLMRLLEEAENGDEECPYIELRATIAFNNEDSAANLVGFLTYSDIAPNSEHCVDVVIHYEAEERESMLEAMRDACQCGGNRLRVLLDEMENIKFVPSYFTGDGTEVKRVNLSKLFSCSVIPATDVSGTHCLSDAFSKILRYQYSVLENVEKDGKSIKSHIRDMNNRLTQCIKDLHGDDINSALEHIRGADIKARLDADVTFEKAAKNLIRYEYEDKGMLVPEDQFGLGYTRLVMVIAHMLDYVERYDDDPLKGSVNLVIIEEPETHMHPQMQELFIQYIGEALETLVEGKGKSLKFQLVITTHSDHIVHSKIHAGGKFDCINYLRESAGIAVSVPLSDELVQPKGEGDPVKNLSFLKKHVCLSVSSVFFADAVLIVEGLSESTLLPYYISMREDLRDIYVSILSVEGAHGFVYENLMEALGVPTAIITDLDVKRTDEEKDDFVQIHSLKGKKTTNKTLIHFAGTEELDSMAFPLLSINEVVKVFSQKESEGYYPTSLEEALVLKNYDSDVFIEELKRLHPKTMEDILGAPEDRKKLLGNSYKCQRKFAADKSDLASGLLYQLLTCEDDKPPIALPDYINDALEDIANRVKGETNAE